MKKFVVKKKVLKKSNKKRRDKYADDSAYRDKNKERSRRAYRLLNNTQFLDRGRNLPSLEDSALKTEVLLLNNKTVYMPVFNIPNASNMMDTKYQTVWRWIKRGMLPEPILHLGANGQPAYHQEEVRVLIEELCKHLQNFAYYRKDHTSTKKAIFSRINNIRKELKLN